MRVLAEKVSDVVSVAIAKSLKESKKDSAACGEKLKNKQNICLRPHSFLRMFPQNMFLSGIGIFWCSGFKCIK